MPRSGREEPTHRTWRLHVRSELTAVCGHLPESLLSGFLEQLSHDALLPSRELRCGLHMASTTEDRESLSHTSFHLVVGGPDLKRSVSPHEPSFLK